MKGRFFYIIELGCQKVLLIIGKNILHKKYSDMVDAGFYEYPCPQIAGYQTELGREIRTMEREPTDAVPMLYCRRFLTNSVRGGVKSEEKV